MTEPRYVRIVNLWIHAGQEAAFAAFEREAARLMARHGGRIDSATRTVDGGPDDPYEVHVVSFPDRASAEAYGRDPATLELRQRREVIIARTLVLEGGEVEPYRH